MIPLTDLAADLAISTEQVLTTLRVVATRAHIDDLAAWATRELEGYANEDNLPTHRCWKLMIVASMHHPMHGVLENVHVGVSAIEEQQRRRVTPYRYRHGVGQAEALLSAAHASSGNLFNVERSDLAQLINSGPVYKESSWTCTRAVGQFSPMHLSTVVTKARQTALRLCLECEGRGVYLLHGTTDQASPERRAWLDTLKQESVKIVIKDVWETILGLGNWQP